MNNSKIAENYSPWVHTTTSSPEKRLTEMTLHPYDMPQLLPACKPLQESFFKMYVKCVYIWNLVCVRLNRPDGNQTRR